MLPTLAFAYSVAVLLATVVVCFLSGFVPKLSVRDNGLERGRASLRDGMVLLSAAAADADTSYDLASAL